MKKFWKSSENKIKFKETQIIFQFFIIFSFFMYKIISFFTLVQFFCNELEIP